MKIKKKKIKALESRVESSLFSKDSVNEESTCELNKFAKMGNKLDRNDLIYKAGNKKNDKTYDFQKFRTIISC